jgi:hypothetical protein
MKKIALLLALLWCCSQANAQWLQQNTRFATPSRGIFHLDISDSATVWATAYDGVSSGNTLDYSRTTNAGTTWTAGTLPGNVAQISCAMIEGRPGGATAYAAVFPQVAAGVAAQGVYVTTNGGTAWTKQTGTGQFSDGNSFINIVHFFDANNGMCMGDPLGGKFEIYTTTNTGTAWVRVDTANIPTSLGGEFGLIKSYSAVGNTIWFGTNSGRVYKSTNRGLNWTVSSTGLGATAGVISVAFGDANTGMAIAYTGPTYLGAARTTDGGTTWVAVSGANLARVIPNEVAAIPGSRRFVVSGAATGGSGSATSSNGGQTWTTIDTTAQRTTVAFLSPTVGWAGGFNTSATVGGVFRYNGTPLSTRIENAPVAKQFALNQNYPNPFNPSTVIEYSLRDAGEVSLKVFDILGREVATLVSGRQSAGSYRATFNATNLSSGAYFYRLQTGSFVETKKMTLVK